jgi:hypothetical protein
MSNDMQPFDQSMYDLQLDISKRWAAEVHRLRSENAALRKTIDNFPSDMSTLQDRVSMLEAMLQRSPPN